MSRALLCRWLGLCLLLLSTTSCLLDSGLPGELRSEANPPPQSLQKVAAPGELQWIGKVKIDEFNDQAIGKEAPTRAGQLVVAFAAEPQSLNTWTDNSAVTQYIAGYLYNSLLRRDPETYVWEGSLAERWLEEDMVVQKDGTKLRGVVLSDTLAGGQDVEIKSSSGNILRVASKDVEEVRKGVSFTFYLRRDVRFHDGARFTAQDVKFSFETIKNEYVDAPSLRNYYKDLESCEVLDNYTVRLTYSTQYWMAREFAGGFEVLPRHIYNQDGLLEKDPQAFGKRFNENPSNRNPIGTGPYKFDRWDTGMQIVLARQDDYWDVPRRGHLNRIVFKFITDPVAALQSLKNGEVNFLPGVTVEQFEEETNDREFLRKFAKVEYYTPAFNYIGWNMRRPPFDDSKVRLAMAYGALDRQEFLEKVLHERGVIVTGSQYYYGPAYDHNLLPYAYDPEKAKQLLLEAGWYDRDGDGLRDKEVLDQQGKPYLKPFRFELLLPSGNDVARRRAAIMKENLRKLGIDMTVRELEWATFLEQINDRKFDACNLGWATSLESDPYQIWHTSQMENRGSNHVGFGNAETDQLIEQSRLTIADEARRKLFLELHRIQHEQQPYLFLYTSPNLGIYDKRYRGVKFYKVRPGYDLTEWFLPGETT
ncbi:MAG: hypothetical protein HY647_12390 [Acidobacteria bacterium]|nr:hypothetical protein [Acidobacteriota bacterium]